MFFDTLPIEMKALLVGLAMALFFGAWAYHDLKKNTGRGERIVRSIGLGAFILMFSISAGYAAPHVHDRVDTLTKEMANEILGSINCKV